MRDFKKELIIKSSAVKNEDTITVEEYFIMWLRDTQKNKLEPSSYMRKENTVKYQVIPHIGNIPINSVEVSDVQDMINSLNDYGYSFSTIKKAYDVTNELFKYYRVITKTYFNPCEGVSLPDSKRKPIAVTRFLLKDEIAKFEEVATSKYKNGKPVFRMGYAAVLLMYTGMREGELCSLKWNDVDFENRSISIYSTASKIKNDIIDTQSPYLYQVMVKDKNKTQSSKRIIPMNDKAFMCLTELHKITGEEKYVCISQNHRLYYPEKIGVFVCKIARRAGIIDMDETCGAHILRHTFASMLFRNGCDVKVISEILGHSSTKITEEIYIHLIQEQKAKAMQKIDDYID